MTGLILGSSGLTGSLLLQQLLMDDDFKKIKVLVRRSSQIQHPKLEEILCNFTNMSFFTLPLGCDVLFSCLGTTRKKTPNLHIYQNIEIDIPYRIGQIVCEQGAKQIHYISAIGANAASSNFYLQMKGEAEKQLSTLPIQQLHIYRPGLITGKRAENRWVEELATKIFPIFNPFLRGKLSKYKSIKALNIAKSMQKNSKLLFSNNPMTHYYSDMMGVIV